jgi:hypothetical protein
MRDRTTPLPCRQPELVVRPLGGAGPYVIKAPGARILPSWARKTLPVLDGLLISIS